MSAVLVEFARTLIEDFSIQEILDRLARSVLEVIPTDGAGVLLLDEQARLHFVSATDERILVIERLQLELGEGPCILSYESGEAVMAPDLSQETRFERFAARAVQEGLGAVYSFPLRIDGRRLGALDLYSRTMQELSAEDVVGRTDPRRRRRLLHLQRPGSPRRRRIGGPASAAGVARPADEAAQPRAPGRPPRACAGEVQAVGHRAPGCCSSISIASRRSMTPMGIWWATGC